MKPSLKGEWKNIMLLCALYCLQGVPIGLAVSVPMYMQSKNATFKQQADFSLSSYPYSLKLLWAPIVDALFTTRFNLGQRKSWILPTQLLAGFIMILVGFRLDALFGGSSPESESGVPGSSINVAGLTAAFFVLYFLVATQDIAVDGWALTMLRPENVGYASTANTVGQTAGIMLAYGVLMALDSKDFANAYVRRPLGLPFAETGLITMSQFMVMWGVAFVGFTLLLWVFKREDAGIHLADNGGQITSAASPNQLSTLAVDRHDGAAPSGTDVHSIEHAVGSAAPSQSRSGRPSCTRGVTALHATHGTMLGEMSMVPCAVSADESALQVRSPPAPARAAKSGRGEHAVAAQPARESEAAAFISGGQRRRSLSGMRHRGSRSPGRGGRPARTPRGSGADSAAEASQSESDARTARRKARASGSSALAMAVGAAAGHADPVQGLGSPPSRPPLNAGALAGSDENADGHEESETAPLRGVRRQRAGSAASLHRSSSSTRVTIPDGSAEQRGRLKPLGDGLTGAPSALAPSSLGVRAAVVLAYRDLWSVLRLRQVLLISFVMLTCKAGFSAVDGATSLVMQGRGVSKQFIALSDIVSTPLQLAAQVALSRLTAGPRPMTLFMRAYPLRVLAGLAWLLVLYGLLQAPPPALTGADGGSSSSSASPSTWTLLLIFVLSNVHSLVTSVMFLAQISFFTQVADPLVGGTYMTLLNTMSNLGGKWPQYLSFRAIEWLTLRECLPVAGAAAHEEAGVFKAPHELLALPCGSAVEKAACGEAGGACVVQRDGFAVVVLLGATLSFVWYVLMHQRVLSLEQAPRSAWALPRGSAAASANHQRLPDNAGDEAAAREKRVSPSRVASSDAVTAS